MEGKDSLQSDHSQLRGEGSLMEFGSWNDEEEEEEELGWNCC